ncbi:MAG: phenylalanine--tRNA ligase subunit alpha [Planctomycetota bacterium]|nr:phenylalanine--tRNA ligase subunit alpha [Planctomycetota bacterium]
MALDEFLAELDQLAEAAAASFAQSSDTSSLESLRVQILGAKSGQLKSAQKGLGQMDPADKPLAGKHFNQTKKRIEEAYAAALERLEAASSTQEASCFDATEPGCRPRIGHLHPITQTIQELKDIFGRLGFSVVEGPEIEDERHNFDALNIDRSHPARDPLDNFYLASPSDLVAAADGDDVIEGSLESPWLLRSQTSTVQIRVMEENPPPIRIVSLGRVYRPDTADATHYPMFHQIEGLLVDTDVTLADLKTVLRIFCSSYLGEDVHVRFRPSFFPFTEPSVEVDMQWGDGWVEMGGAGMVDPNVFRAVGYDPEQVTGFAFGLGVERLCARRFGITDIREFFKNDIRFLKQF